MSNDTAVIVIDSGFSQGSVARVKNVLGVYDLTTGKILAAAPSQFLERSTLSFLGDQYLNHGSLVLDKLTQLAPDAPYVLIRAFGPEDEVIARQKVGTQVTLGWTDAYAWATALCASHHFSSVANCSFGTSLMTDEERSQLAEICNADNDRTHIIVAASRPLPSSMSDIASLAYAIAVGLKNCRYQEAGKPDLLLSGEGPISFRIPAVTARVRTLMRDGTACKVDTLKKSLSTFVETLK